MERTQTSNPTQKLGSTSSTLFSQESVKELSESVNEMTEKVKAAADTAVTESINFAKKYPVHTALGAVAVGFVIGFFARSASASSRK